MHTIILLLTYRKRLINSYFLLKLGREREERNYYQLERDRLSTFWDVATKQLEESRAECRVKDRELEETEERHQMEVKIYKQKVKHLLYEQENHLAGLKAENMLSLKVAREEHQRQEQQHLNDKQLLTAQLHDKDKQYQELLRDTKTAQSEEIERLREAFEERVREMEKRYSTRVSNLRHDLQLRLKSEVSETEERKNAQIEQMKRKHEKAFNEIKNYYNDITLNNLAMISTLKEEIKAKEEKLERNEQLLATVQTENKKLAEPLRKAREQLVELQRQLGSQEKEKSALISAQSKLKSSQKKVENLSWEVEVLKQKYDRALRERDEIHERFSSAIIDMQQKSGLKYKILERKIVTMREQLDVKDAQLHASSKGPVSSASQQLQSKADSVRDVVLEQNDRIRRLERQISQMRLRREWGDVSSPTITTSSGSSSSESSSSVSGSTGGSGGSGTTSRTRSGTTRGSGPSGQQSQDREYLSDD